VQPHALNDQIVPLERRHRLRDEHRTARLAMRPLLLDVARVDFAADPERRCDGVELRV
jgi:hypothetical protein